MASQASQSTCTAALSTSGPARKTGPAGSAMLNGAMSRRKLAGHAPSTAGQLQTGKKDPWAHHLHLAKQHMARAGQLLLQLAIYVLQLVASVCQKVLPFFNRLKGVLWVLAAKLLSSPRGRYLLAAIAAVTCVRVRFSSFVTEDSACEQSAGSHSGSPRACAPKWPCLHTSVNVSVLWDCLRLQAHLQFRYPRWLPRTAQWCLSSIHTAARSTYQQLAPGSPGQRQTPQLKHQPQGGNTTVLLQEEDGNQELTRTILRFLEDQQQRTPGCQVFRIRSPHKGDGDSSLFTPHMERTSSSQLLVNSEVPLECQSPASSINGDASHFECARPEAASITRSLQQESSVHQLENLSALSVELPVVAISMQAKDDHLKAVCSQQGLSAVQRVLEMHNDAPAGSMAEVGQEGPQHSLDDQLAETAAQCSSPCAAQAVARSPSLCSTQSMSPQDAAACWHTRFERGPLTTRYDAELETSSSSHSSKHAALGTTEDMLGGYQQQGSHASATVVEQVARLQGLSNAAGSSTGQPQQRAQHAQQPLSSSFVQGLAAQDSSQIQSAALRYACRMAALAARSDSTAAAAAVAAEATSACAAPSPTQRSPRQQVGVRSAVTPQLRLLMTRPAGTSSAFGQRSVDAATSPFSSSAIQAALRVPRTHTRPGAPETAAAVAVARAARSMHPARGASGSVSSRCSSMPRQQGQVNAYTWHSRRASHDSNQTFGTSQQQAVGNSLEETNSCPAVGVAARLAVTCQHDKRQRLDQLHSWDAAAGPSSGTGDVHPFYTDVCSPDDDDLSGPFGSTQLAADFSQGHSTAALIQNITTINTQPARPTSPTFQSSQSPFAGAGQRRTVTISTSASPTQPAPPQQGLVQEGGRVHAPTSTSSPAPASPATSSAASAHSSSCQGSSLLSYESAVSQLLLERSTSNSSLGGKSMGDVGSMKGAQSNSRASPPGSRSGRKPAGSSLTSMSRKGSVADGEDHHPLTRPMSSSLTFGGVLF